MPDDRTEVFDDFDERSARAYAEACALYDSVPYDPVAHVDLICELMRLDDAAAVRRCLDIAEPVHASGIARYAILEDVLRTRMTAFYHPEGGAA